MRIAYAPFANPDAPIGYGVIAKKLREGLQEAGATILPSTSFGWDCVLAISLPAAWPVQNGKRADLVWHTMFELEPMPPPWVEVLNRSAGVWVPSTWCKSLFDAHGVNTPMFVSGYGVDRQLFYPADRSERDDKPLRVLVWSMALVGRKNPLMALRAFQKAGFPVDQAEIEIKVNVNQGQEHVKGPDGQYLPNARVIAEDWPTSRVAEWLRSGDVLVYLSSGEGFGLMPLEAMATGLPVICAYNTGMMDFLHSDWAMLVPSLGKRKNVGYSLRFGVDAYEETPDEALTTEYLRWCFEHRAEMRAMGERAAQAAAEWTWKRTGETALAYLQPLFGP